MMVLITYDVNTEDPSGRKRLRKVAKTCINYGQRVQNSVFECTIDPAQFVKVKSQLDGIIDHQKDSLRFYLLGKNWISRVETMGRDGAYNPESDVFILERTYVEHKKLRQSRLKRIIYLENTLNIFTISLM